MPSAPFWETTPDVWDVLVLGGHTLPGLTSISGRASRKMDVRSPPGGDGARVRDRGYEPAALEARNRVWLPEQLEQLQEVLTAIHPRRANAGPSQARARSSAATDRELAELEEQLGRDPQLFRDDKELTDRLTLLSQRQTEQRRRAEAGAPRSSRTPVDVVHPSLAMLGIRSVYVTGVSVPVLEEGVMVTTISLLEWTPVPQPAPRPATGSGGLEGIMTALDASRDETAPTASTPSSLPKNAFAKRR